MPYQKSFPLPQIGFLGFAVLSLTVSAFAGAPQSKSPETRSRQRFQRPAIGLEITSPHKAAPLYKGSGPGCVFDLKALSLINREAAKDFDRVMLVAKIENEAVKVRLAMQSGEVVEHEWKTRAEKVVGSYTIAVGDSLTPAELLQYGIEPFTIKAISNKPVILKPEEYPRLFNFANLLEVVEVEKSLDGYLFSFKNISNKKIVAFETWSGNNGLGHGGLISEDTFDEINNFHSSDIERHGLTLKFILFEDRTYEGDARIAARYFARWEGEAVQAAKLLLLIEQTSRVSHAELPEVFDKLETGLWKMQEAMDKASAIEFLKIKYSNFDDETISALYEEFKGGFYSARNAAIYPLEQGKRRLKEDDGEYLEANKIIIIRNALSEAKSQLEKLTSASRAR